jgi:hypothetical protein
VVSRLKLQDVVGTPGAGRAVDKNAAVVIELYCQELHIVRGLLGQSRGFYQVLAGPLTHHK